MGLDSGLEEEEDRMVDELKDQERTVLRMTKNLDEVEERDFITVVLAAAVGQGGSEWAWAWAWAWVTRGSCRLNRYQYRCRCRCRWVLGVLDIRVWACVEVRPCCIKWVA